MQQRRWSSKIALEWSKSRQKYVEFEPLSGKSKPQSLKIRVQLS
jgi:hypothetical protein